MPAAATAAAATSTFAATVVIAYAIDQTFTIFSRSARAALTGQDALGTSSCPAGLIAP